MLYTVVWTIQNSLKKKYEKEADKKIIIFFSKTDWKEKSMILFCYNFLNEYAGNEY